MKKYLLLISLLTLLFPILWSCEKDEICLEETTPRLIIRFYDNEDPSEFKKVSNIIVQIEGISGDYFNGSITSSTDSIAIPIKVTEDITKFKFILNGNDTDDTNDNTDTFDLNYTREDIFVSRSCGYKTIFHDVETTLEIDSENWIIDIKTVADPQAITNQKSKHVKIFH
ncbi:MAG: hypothetical protein KAT78_01115 [Flavobacteriaceae bacterium]|nr:hypothetical protein [Flavobacteriaceae bacterium]